MSKLTINQDIVTTLGITWPLMNLVDETRLKCLRMSTTNLWKEIIGNYRIISQIFDKKNIGGTGDVNNNSDNKNAYIKTRFKTYNIVSANADTNIEDTSSIKDAGSIVDVDINFNNKNTHKKASFSTYNIKDINMDANNINGIGDANDTSSTDNNVNNKNANTKTSFSTHNVASIDTDDISDIGKKVSNNINNIGIGYSSTEVGPIKVS